MQFIFEFRKILKVKEVGIFLTAVHFNLVFYFPYKLSKCKLGRQLLILHSLASVFSKNTSVNHNQNVLCRNMTAIKF